MVKVRFSTPRDVERDGHDRSGGGSRHGPTSPERCLPNLGTPDIPESLNNPDLFYLLTQG